MHKRSKPKVVLFDLETVPDMDRAFKRWTTLSQWYGTTLSADLQSIICFGYKILGERSTKIKCAWDFPGWQKSINDDKELCKLIYNTLKDADMIVTHNGIDFDLKVLQTRLAYHKLPILPELVHIDTKREARRHLRMSSNSLQNISQFFTNVPKMDSGGWELWEKVRARDKSAMKKMAAYCKQDVRALEEIYLVLRPFVKKIVNHNMFAKEQMNCPSCGSLSLKKHGKRVYKGGIQTRLQCQECGSWSRMSEKDAHPKNY